MYEFFASLLFVNLAQVDGRVLVELDFARAFVALGISDVKMLASLKEAFKLLVQSTALPT